MSKKALMMLVSAWCVFTSIGIPLKSSSLKTRYSIPFANWFGPTKLIVLEKNPINIHIYTYVPVFWMKPAALHLPWNTQKKHGKMKMLKHGTGFFVGSSLFLQCKKMMPKLKKVYLYNTFRKPSSNLLVRFFFVLLLVEKGPLD